MLTTTTRKLLPTFQSKSHSPPPTLPLPTSLAPQLSPAPPQFLNFLGSSQETHISMYSDITFFFPDHFYLQRPHINKRPNTLE